MDVAAQVQQYEQMSYETNQSKNEYTNGYYNPVPHNTNLSSSEDTKNSSKPKTTPQSIQALENVLQYLEKLDSSESPLSSPALNFLTNPRLKQILVLHDRLLKSTKLTDGGKKETKSSDFQQKLNFEDSDDDESLMDSSNDEGSSLEERNLNQNNNRGPAKKKNSKNVPEISTLLEELNDHNVSFLNSTSHLVQLLSAYQSISSKTLNLPTLDEFEREMDRNMQQIENQLNQENIYPANTQHDSLNINLNFNDSGHFDHTTHTSHPSKLISLEKQPGEKLGVTIKKNDRGQIVIGRVLKGEKADLSGLIHTGDILQEINGVSLDTYTAEEVISLVARTTGSLDIVTAPQHNSNSLRNSLRSTTGIFLKSRINWDPVKDKGIPCKDDHMSVSIRMGDILEILSKDEQNWWQARKVGSVFEEECGMFGNPSKTGIIPSPYLLEKRVRTKALLESNSQTALSSNSPGRLSGDSSNSGTPTKKKKGLGAITRKLSMKKSKSMSASSLSLNSRSHLRLNDPYCELRKTNPAELKRRPLIIMGTRGIGCSELKERLLDANPSLYSTPIPHTSRPALINERDGKDYHFVEKPDMQKMIDQSQFIEWGEYNNNFYGTSVDAIRAIKFNGKVGIMSPMNLDQAIPRLYTASIQAFVVFITVPKKLEGENEIEYTVEEQEAHEKLYQQSCELYRKFNGQIDRVIVKQDFDQCFRELEAVSFSVLNDQQWVPSRWIG